MSKKHDAIRDEAIRILLAPETEGGINLKPGDTIYTVLRHRSSSGMFRVIDLFVIRPDLWSGKQSIRSIGYLVADALGMSHDREREGIKVSGCGMDMGFNLVYNLSSALFPEGFGEIGYKLNANSEIDRSTAKRPANKRVLRAMLKVGYKFHGRNGDLSGWDDNGGYALKHEWI